MEKELFVNSLKLLTPLRDDFKEYKVSESYIDNFISRYNCVPKVERQLKVTTNDEVLNLLQDYDCSTIGIGNLSFLKEIGEHRDYYQIGKAEIDPIVLNKNTLEIEVRDHDQLDHVIWFCSSKSAYFLDALLACAEFLTSLFLNPSIDENDSYIQNVINDCAEKAGGEKYIDFYEMLLR